MRKTRAINKITFVDPRAKIARNCVIEPNTRILGKVEIGSNTRVCANVTIQGPGRIGGKCYVGSNSVIGFPTRESLRHEIDGKIKKSDSTFFKIGNHVVVRTNSVIYTKTDIGNYVELGHNVLVRENVKIGEKTLIGTNVIIDGQSKIGSNVSMQTGVYISINTKVKDNAFLGPQCALINDKFMRQRPCKLRGPTIGRWASIGANSVIMPGVIVGEKAVIGAGAVVTKNVKAKTIVAGVPATKINKSKR
ncbi:MAG: DapH/DapD/GlmU-related protein [Candidatus Bathyarchaeota archaeon]